MILTLIGAGAVLVLGGIVLVRQWHKHRHDIVCVPLQPEADFIHAFGDPDLPPKVIVTDCEDSCPCKNHSPHFHWIDLHREVLRCYRDCFVALHPVNGVVIFDPNIRGFVEKIGDVHHEERAVLMILHTSMLSQET